MKPIGIPSGWEESAAFWYGGPCIREDRLARMQFELRTGIYPSATAADLQLNPTSYEWGERFDLGEP